MLNKLLHFLRQYDMLQQGDELVCAVSGGADSMAMLFAMYLLSDKLKISVSAAHFNHGLRGAESDRDEAFVRDFCAGYQIPFVSGKERVIAGKKGLEAAAREARYAFLLALSGKIATAHTANDNAETVLMHLVRGTGLKGLGGIAPVSEKLIRPMLSVTRVEVLSFLTEYHIPYVEDSTNHEALFLRNRLRHKVIPLLEEENPRLAENLSAMALRLREDEKALSQIDSLDAFCDVSNLRQMNEARRSRLLAKYLESCGVREPEAAHIGLANKLVFSDNPSAKADFPGGITLCREYNTLKVFNCAEPIPPTQLRCPDTIELSYLNLRIVCAPAKQIIQEINRFTVCPKGEMILRSRQEGDTIRLSGGSKALKKLFIDRKIPASQRASVPVFADDDGILGVFGVGVNQNRIATQLPAVEIRIEKIEQEESQ